MNIFVILAYNEEQNLACLLTSVQEAASKLDDPYRLVLVNDGSTDGTVALAESFRATIPILIEHHYPNQGVGEGFKTGFRAALTLANHDDIIITMEADNTCDLSLLPGMVQKIRGGADVVLASCYAPGGEVQGVSVQREVMSRGVNIVMRILFPIERGHTYSSFYRAYRSGILRKAMSRFGESFIVTRGFTSAAEILLKLRRVGAVMDEIPMVLRFSQRNGHSKMKVMATIIDYLRFLSREVGLEARHKMSGGA